MRDRRPLEPRDGLDRFLYALLTITGPGALYIIFPNPAIRWAGAILAAWWLVAAFYTFEWAVLAYRARRRR